MVVATMLLMLVLLGVPVKLDDLKRKREEEAVAAQARVSDALLMDANLAGLPLTPTAHLLLWKGSPLVLEIKGAVPRPELREAAEAGAKLVGGFGRAVVRVADRIVVNPGCPGHPAQLMFRRLVPLVALLVLVRGLGAHPA